MTFTLQPTLTLHERRCYDCGVWWASESPSIGTCPNCATRRIDAAYETTAKLERSLRSMRGAMTRARRRRLRR